LSGLNAATVGIIALAAVQLSQKAITDKTSRILVFFGATAGMLYNTLWYFPVLMVVGGLSTIVWDYNWLQKTYRTLRPPRRTEPSSPPHQDIEASENATELTATESSHPPERRHHPSVSRSSHDATTNLQSGSHRSQMRSDDVTPQDSEGGRTVPEVLKIRVFSWKFGTSLIVCFFVTFIIIMVLRGVLSTRPRGFSLFANLFLAGTIIFGGGPVVIPLLRELVFPKAKSPASINYQPLTYTLLLDT
jgi:chromate transport protein ChrA